MYPLCLIEMKYFHYIPCDSKFIILDNSNCYIFKSGSWITGPTMVNEKAFAAMTLSPFTYKPQYLFVTGGYKPGIGLSSAEILTDNGWEYFSPSLPVGIYHHCMVLVNSTTVLVIGGFQKSAYSTQTYWITDSRKVKKIKVFLILNLITINKKKESRE